MASNTAIASTTGRDFSWNLHTFNRVFVMYLASFSFSGLLVLCCILAYLLYYLTEATRKLIVDVEAQTISGMF